MSKEVMNETMNKELLSRLLDDDLNEHQMNKALDALLEDPAAQQSWHTMHMARGVLSEDSEEGGHASLSLLDKITASIDDEPVVLAPENLAPSASEIKDTKQKEVTRMPAYIALAASVVALITFIGYSPIQDKARTEIVMTPQSQIQAKRELQSMVVQHGEFSGAAALNGLVAYVKVVNGSTAPGVLP